MSRRERTTKTAEYAVREHDGRITEFDNRYGDALQNARKFVESQNYTLERLRIAGRASLVKRTVTTTVVTVTRKTGWADS